MPNKTRTAIFAHFDKDNVIDDYVIYYLNALKKVAQKLVFVSDCNLNAAETDKLKGIADEIIATPHGEHDFGSYKRGFLFAQENDWLNGTDMLIFANDSCYGPFFPLRMPKECDFWGITKNETGVEYVQGKYKECPKTHLQSYFLVFNKKVFLSEVFIEFINSIKKEKNKHEIIINNEIGLSQKLLDCGFKMSTFITNDYEVLNPTLAAWNELILDENMPFLKCSVPRGEHKKHTARDDWKKIITQVSSYPVEIIEKNLKRTRFKKYHKCLNFFKNLRKRTK